MRGDSSVAIYSRFRLSSVVMVTLWRWLVASTVGITE